MVLRQLSDYLVSFQTSDNRHNTGFPIFRPHQSTRNDPWGTWCFLATVSVVYALRLTPFYPAQVGNLADDSTIAQWSCEGSIRKVLAPVNESHSISVCKLNTQTAIDGNTRTPSIRPPLRYTAHDSSQPTSPLSRIFSPHPTPIVSTSPRPTPSSLSAGYIQARSTTDGRCRKWSR